MSVRRSKVPMKDSGIPWIGEVPEHWEVMKFGHLTSIVTCGHAATPTYVDQQIGVPFLSAQNIRTEKIDLFEYRFIRPELHKTLSRHRKIVPGDLLQVRVGGASTIGMTAVVDLDFNFSIYVSLAHIRVNHRAYNRYVKHLCNSSNFREECAHVMKTGAGVANLNISDLIQVKAPVPPLPTQKAIADFLDKKTAALDALIDKKQKLLTLLAEKRAALINQAVTQGLDPSVPMKDSGIPWIGEIPEHWEVSALRWVCRPGTSITYGIVQAGPHVEEGVPYIRVSEMSGDELPRHGYKRTSHDIDSSYSRSRVFPGDLVIAIRASVGKVLMVPDYLPMANLTQGTAKVSVRHEQSNRFVYWAVRGEASQSALWRYAKGATFKEITLEVLRKLQFARPPRAEQDAIADYLAAGVAKLDSTDTKVTAQIDKLQEYRQALITAAVTGQLDIEEAA